jgi:hypothetical protein
MKKHRNQRLIVLGMALAALLLAVYFGWLHHAGSAHRINP